MVKTLNFYLDESGPRHPDKKIGRSPAHSHDYFAFGGILVSGEEEARTRELHAAFCSSWGIEYPLHSAEIRGKTENFSWIKSLTGEESGRFYEELYGLLRISPVTGLACVIDRPGYNARYSERFKENKWSLCKTAFNIAIERAAKISKLSGRRLNVYCERCNKKEDHLAAEYIKTLKTEGMPFNPGTSAKYSPMSGADFAEILYDFKLKYKSSPMIQLADLFLWPICMGGYHQENRTYARLIKDGKLIECKIKPEEIGTLGSKYSCFELEQEKSKTRTESPGLDRPPPATS